MNLKESVLTLNGIGPKKLKELNKLGITSLEDLLNYYPRGYQDRRSLKNIKECHHDESVGIKARVIGNGVIKRISKTLKIVSIPISDETGKGYAVWFNQQYILKNIQLGNEYIFFGRINKNHSRFQIESPDYSNTKEDDIHCILPIYSLTKGITQKDIRSSIKQILNSVTHIEDYIPLNLRRKYDICEVNKAYHNIHFSLSNHAIVQARKRLAFNELLELYMGLQNIKEKNTQNKGINLNKDSRVYELIENLPFELTNSQYKVLDEIYRDLTSGKIMNRLVQGDVGSGKTIIAVISLYLTALNGYQGIFMVPTEILAEQHYNTIDNILEPLGVKTYMLSSGLTKKNKEMIIKKIQSGEANIIVGTHAIIQKGVAFKNPGLVITDEQHRFGVKQRALLESKGIDPHVLVMSATPIPRTLSLIIFGDLEISIINEMPLGRIPIKTFCVNSNYKKRIYDFIKREIEKGRQAYIVCPLVEDNDIDNIMSVTKLFQEIKENYIREYPISIIHGKLKSKDKNNIMKQFKDGEIKVLISTTVIEVGIDVENATIMVIENAERFGLAQLHQLRGRVGRGRFQSYCILITDNTSKKTKERMGVMTQTQDGFIIAEKDLQLRGPGDYFGVKQHGVPELKIANIITDKELVLLARDVAMELLKMNNSDIIKFREKILQKFREKLINITLN